MENQTEKEGIIVAVDVHYRDNYAKGVLIGFNEWKSPSPSLYIEKNFDSIEEYIPGQFYKRELPCILQLINEVKSYKINAIIIDGYVYISDSNEYGLGGHLFESLKKEIPVIGVAKSKFHSLNNVIEVFRGTSKNPLYVSAIGMENILASKFVLSMDGKYRFPNILKLLDKKTKV